MEHRHMARVARFDAAQLRREIRAVEGANAKLAVAITGAVGTMACAYVFAAIALISLPAAIASGQTIVLVAWVAQTFLQLVLLSIIMVGQRVQAAASDTRADKEYADTELLVDRLDEHTAGGITAVLDEVRQLRVELRAQFPETSP